MQMDNQTTERAQTAPTPSLCRSLVGFAVAHERTVVLALIAAGLALRLAYIWASRHIDFAPQEMARVAMALAAGKGFSNAYGLPLPTAIVSPTYPLLTSVAYLLFEQRTAFIFLSFVSALFFSINTFAVGELIRKVGASPGARILGTGAVTCVPLNLYFDTLMGGEWELTFISVILSLHLLHCARIATMSQQGIRIAVVHGLSLGFIILTSAAFALAALAASITAVIISHLGIVRAIRSIAISGIVAADEISPWVIRNAVVFGELILSRSNAGLEFAIGNHAKASARTFDTPGQAAHFGSIQPLHTADARARFQQIGEPALPISARLARGRSNG